MRILSQENLPCRDLPYENTVVYIDGDNKGIKALSGGIVYVMAEYSTKSKARNAMEMLHEAYTGIPLILQNVDISDDVKEMFEKWKKQGICVVSENQPSKVEYVGNILFQFPSDDEVEV